MRVATRAVPGAALFLGGRYGCEACRPGRMDAGLSRRAGRRPGDQAGQPACRISPGTAYYHSASATRSSPRSWDAGDGQAMAGAPCPVACEPVTARHAGWRNAFLEVLAETSNVTAAAMRARRRRCARSTRRARGRCRVRRAVAGRAARRLRHARDGAARLSARSEPAAEDGRAPRPCACSPRTARRSSAGAR